MKRPDKRMNLQRRLLGFLALCQAVNLVAADVYIMTSAYVFDPLPDIPADFGPDIPDAGIEGVLQLADPLDACSPFTFADFTTPWIALIARQQQPHPNNCTFDIKVLNAQNAGAMAAIVYDDVTESLIIMSKPKGHPDPYIPSVFVSQKAGYIMRKLMTGDTIRVRITPLSSVAWLSMLMSAFLGVLALGVVLATFYVMRSWSMWLTGMHVRGTPGAGGQAAHDGQPGQTHPAAGPPQDPGLPAEALRLLPVVVFEPPVGARGSRADTGPASAVSGAASSQPGSLSRTPALGVGVGAAVWEEEAVGEEMQPLLLAAAGAAAASEGAGGGGDVEQGCGTYGSMEVQEEVDYEVASRSSSESGVTILATAARLPRPPGAHAGETKRVCAICLESYVEGEKIRVLPCAHRFHMGCVDQWLGSRRYCPVCKHDASQPLPHPPRAGGGSGSSGAGARGGAVAAGANGWMLLFQGLVDLIRHPRATPRPRTQPSIPIAINITHQQQHQHAPAAATTTRTRSRRQPYAADPHAELQEPLMPAAAAPASGAAAALPADVEAPGPSQPAPVAAAATSALASATILSAGPSASTSAPIAIPANASSTSAAARGAEVMPPGHAGAPAVAATAAAAPPPTPQAVPAAAGSEAARAQAQVLGSNAGAAARVRAMLAGLWRSPGSSHTGAQYSTTL